MVIGPEDIKAFRQWLGETGRTRATIDSYARDAASFLEFARRYSIPTGDFCPETLLQYSDHLRHDLGERENSVRRKVIGIRQFFRHLAANKRLPATPFDDAPIPKRLDLLPGQLNYEKILNMIRQPTSRSALKKTRDRSILSLLAFEGLKVGEIISLEWGDLMQAGDSAVLRINGTHGRVIHLGEQTAAALRSYATEIKKEIAESGSTRRMFVGFKGRDGARILPQMTRHGLKFMLYEEGRKAGISQLNTERLRHFSIEYQFQNGKSAEEIMNHLGLRRPGIVGRHLSKLRRSVVHERDYGNP